MERVGTEDVFTPVLKTLARKVLPVRIRSALWRAVDEVNEWKTAFQLARLRRHMFAVLPGISKTVQMLHYTLHTNDGRISYDLYEDIFIEQIYHFEAQRSAPFILDLGSHIGISILYFKHIYPQARIIGFEPDSLLFLYLRENITKNGLADVQLVQAAVAGREGTQTFYSDGGKIGSSLSEHLLGDISRGWVEYEVPCVRLRDYLTEPVDLIKMNVEGAEWEVLADSEDRLHHVREMIIEYHHFPELPRSLHKILDLLHRHHFEYVVSDFGLESFGLQPPVRLHPQTRYCRLIYARRMS